jgi:hypothetical protein
MKRRMLLGLILVLVLAGCEGGVPAPGEPPTPTSIPRPTSTATARVAEPSYIKQLTVYEEGFRAYAIYFILADRNGAMVASEGTAKLTISQGSGSDEKVLLSKTYPVQRTDFVETKVGQGAFARDALICSFGRLSYDDFDMAPTEASGKVKVQFTLKSGKKLDAEESVYFDDLPPTITPVPLPTETPIVFPAPGTPAPPVTGTTGPSGALFDVPEPITYRMEYVDYLVFAGVAKYNGDTLRSDPEIIITLLDEQGNVLSTEQASTRPGHILPQSLVPYKVLIDDPPEKWAKMQIEVNAEEPSDFMRGYIYTDVVVEGVTLKPGTRQFDNLEVLGKVKNTGAKTVSSVEVIVTAYDEGDKLIDVFSGYVVQDTIEPGEAGTFEVRSSQIKNAKRVELTVTARPK